MASIDDAFLALPATTLADAALSRARELGATHADFRLERIRRSVAAACATASSTPAPTTRTSGLAVRVVHEGAWGFASGIDRTPEAAARLAEQAVATARLSRVLSSRPGRAGRRAGVPRRDLGVGLRDQPVRRAGRPTGSAGSPSCRSVLRRADGVDHVDAELIQVQENKFYADTAGTRPPSSGSGSHPEFTAVHVDRANGGFSSMRTPGAAGRPRLGVPDRHRLGLRRRDRRAARAAGRARQGAVGRGRPLRPGHRSVQPVADHPRVDRARHRAGPGAGLRGGLRRHLVRHLRPAGHPAVRQRGHERDRRPHRRARPGHASATTTRGWPPAASTSSATASWSATSSTGRWRAANGLGRSNGCAYADSPGHIPMQRMANVSLQPSPDGPSRDDLIAGVERGHLHRRRQVLVDRHAALQLPVHRPAVLPDRERPAGRAAARRRLPGHHHRLLGLDGGRRRPARPTCWAAPSTAARASRARWRRSRTAARRRCSAASTCSTP